MPFAFLVSASAAFFSTMIIPRASYFVSPFAFVFVSNHCTNEASTRVK